MIVYWVGIVLSILLFRFLQIARVPRLNGKKMQLSANARALFSSIPLVAIAGLRYNVGTDYFSYIYEYNMIGSGAETRYEPLYVFLNKVLFYLNAPVVVLFFITALIFCFFVFRGIIDNSENPELSIFLLVGCTFFFLFLNGMRQMIACSICFYAIKYIREKKFFTFLFFVVISMGFHFSSGLFLAVYLFSKIRINRIWATIILVVVFLLSNTIVDLAIRYVSQLDYYKYYLTYDNSKLEVWLYVNIAVFLFSSIVADFDDDKYRLFYICQLLIACLSIFNGKIVLLSRIMWVFCLPQLVLIPEAISKIDNYRTKQFVQLCIIVLYVFYSSYSVAIRGANNVVPYYSVLFQ